MKIKSRAIGEAFRIVEHSGDGPPRLYFERRAADATGGEKWDDCGRRSRGGWITLPEAIVQALYAPQGAAAGGPIEAALGALEDLRRSIQHDRMKLRAQRLISESRAKEAGVSAAIAELLLIRNAVVAA